jgi:hypothetical protein
MPSLHQHLSIFGDNCLDSPQFTGLEPNVSVKTDRIEPDLHHGVVSLDMNVRWFVPVSRIEEEPVWAAS